MVTVILTLENVHRRSIEHFDSPLKFFVSKFWNVDVLGPPPDLDDVHGVVRVEVNNGDWIVRCPAFGCGGTVLTSGTDHRFVCITCGLGPVAVEWPEERDAIEAALDDRPKQNRNWRWAESVDDLVEETVTWKVVRLLAGGV